MAKRTVAVIGGGPTGLMAAETLASAGTAVTVFERMANPGRKLLLAGRGGLNLTHSEPFPGFLTRYGSAAEHLRAALNDFPPDALANWSAGLAQPTFVGTSGRVFPKSLKASPLLRAWLARLDDLGVSIRRGTRWTGWTNAGGLALEGRDGTKSSLNPDAVVLALGGASWPRLGSDGGWVSILEQRGVRVTPLAAANCGVRIGWSKIFLEKFAGEPLKRIGVSAGSHYARGEAVVTSRGLEGGAIYQLVPTFRSELEVHGSAKLLVDLKPDLPTAGLTAALAGPIGKQTVANMLRKSIGLAPVAISLLREVHGSALSRAPGELAAAIKALPLTITGLEPLDRAISTAGGIAWDELDSGLMLKRLPGVFAAGEMLDWEAPTGGYLLQACFSLGVAVAKGVLTYLA